MEGGVIPLVLVTQLPARIRQGSSGKDEPLKSFVRRLDPAREDVKLGAKELVGLEKLGALSLQRL